MLTCSVAVWEVIRGNGDCGLQGRCEGGGGGHGRSADLVDEEGIVVGALLVSELHPDHHLLRLWQVLHVLLHAPKKNGPQLLLDPTQQLSVIHSALCLMQT